MAKVKRIRFRAFHFRNTTPGPHWGVKLADWHMPLFGIGRRYGQGLGWSIFQPWLGLCLGHVGVTLGFFDAPRRLELSVYTYPGGWR